MKMVEDLHTLPRRWSTRIAAAQGSLVLFWVSLPAEWKAAVPGWALTITVAILAFSFIAAQSVSQPKLKDECKEEPKP